jgi:hypothetical protein
LKALFGGGTTIAMTSTLTMMRHPWRCMTLLLLWMLLLLTVATIEPSAELTEDVQATLDEAWASLERNNKDISSHSVSLEGLSRDIDELENGLQRLDDLSKKLQQEHSRLHRLVQTANIQRWRDLVERLDQTFQKERQVRRILAEAEVSYQDNNNSVTLQPEDIVTMDMLHQRLDTNVIVQESELQLKKWILQAIQEELERYKQDTWSSKMPTLSTTIAEMARDDDAAIATIKNSCPGTAEIVQRVQQALTDYANDGIGKVDHVQRGAKIVHWLTSETYVPPPSDAQTLGSVWWRKYIPQDWERLLLPKGWENWSTSTFPSYLSHILVRAREKKKNSQTDRLPQSRDSGQE